MAAIRLYRVLYLRHRQAFFQHSNGIWESFVVGIDRAVWHIWQRYVGDPTWTGWHSLGGVAVDGI